VRVDPPFAVPGFLGSPTVHVNGIDIEPSARTSKWIGVQALRRNLMNRKQA
jgi:hypothetical protein